MPKVDSPAQRPSRHAGHPSTSSWRERNAKSATDRKCTRCRTAEVAGQQCWRDQRRPQPSVPVARRPQRGPGILGCRSPAGRSFRRSETSASR
eukprot:6078131-Pleurochrysis_carterae.AAC.1